MNDKMYIIRDRLIQVAAADIRRRIDDNIYLVANESKLYTLVNRTCSSLIRNIKFEPNIVRKESDGIIALFQQTIYTNKDLYNYVISAVSGIVEQYYNDKLFEATGEELTFSGSLKYSIYRSVAVRMSIADYFRKCEAGVYNPQEGHGELCVNGKVVTNVRLGYDTFSLSVGTKCYRLDDFMKKYDMTNSEVLWLAS